MNTRGSFVSFAPKCSWLIRMIRLEISYFRMDSLCMIMSCPDTQQSANLYTPLTKITYFVVAE